MITSLASTAAQTDPSDRSEPQLFAQLIVSSRRPAEAAVEVTTSPRPIAEQAHPMAYTLGNTLRPHSSY